MLATVALAGCGGEDDYKNELRPPSPINITALISERAVSVSPATFGGGPIVLVVANQSSNSQEATLETDTLSQTDKGVTQTSGLINPGGTGTLKVDVTQGTYTLRVGNPAIRPATIEVGAKRPSAQNDVLLP